MNIYNKNNKCAGEFKKTKGLIKPPPQRKTILVAGIDKSHTVYIKKGKKKLISYTI